VSQTLDAFIVPLRLQESGYTVSQATQLFGQLSGMAGTLVNLPGVITVSLATALVPAISGAAARGQREAVVGRLNGAVKLCLLLTLPMAAGFYLLAGPICDLLFGQPAAGIPLQALSPAVLFLGLYQVSAAVLQGLGRPGLPVRHLLLAAALKVGANYYLVGLPQFGIQGAALATGMAFAFAAAMNLLSLFRLLGYRIPGQSVLLKPAAAVTIMAASIKVYQWQTGGPAGGWETLALISASGVVYGMAALLLGAVERRELMMVPGIGPALASWLGSFGLARG
ncbi:MAG: polysaccharide biosynthesis C-terminal domain-containing protein, partial [Syntrophomonadaceae bacterium]|nr:polysaccharide biosynthesis C-terminal domain-containing protein [Syntrophomonadaceae bacterium]